MKKRIMKILCVMLTLVITLSSVSIAFAKENVIPVICVHGLGGAQIYKNANMENESAIASYGLDVTQLLLTENIRNELLKAISPPRTVDDDKFFNTIGDYFAKVGINCDKNGNPLDNSGINNYWEDSLANHPGYITSRDTSEEAIARQICAKVGAKNTYAFNYDWRLDICETARKLKVMVEKVKKEKGVKQVVLVGSSLGGAVLSAYMDAYKKDNDVARYIFVNPAIMGVDVASMYAMDAEVTKSDVLAFLKTMETAFDGGSQSTLFKAISALGDVRIGYLADYLCEVASNPTRLAKLMNNAIKPYIGNIPAYWECIPYSQFDKAVSSMTKVGFLDKNSGLYKKLLNYHNVQGRVKSNLKAVKAQGAEVAIFAGYGNMGIPVTSKIANQTDILIDTKYASGGATVANYGFALNRSGKYVSPDKVIDASTCALPDNTWFIRDVQHMQVKYNCAPTKLIANLAAGECKLDIASVKRKYGYNQFFRADSAQNIINITAADNPQLTGSGWQKISGKWYYFNSSKKMVTHWYKVKGKWYFFNVLGQMQTGWHMIKGKWYFLDGSGAMATGWKLIRGKWYCFNSSGAMLTGWVKSGNQWYYMNPSGEMRHGCWLKYKNNWYYFNQNGTMRTSWLSYKGKWYSFKSTGECTNP